MPKAEQGKYTVLRDTNEQAGYGWSFEANDRCAGTTPFNMYTGDYSLDGYYQNKAFVIERKSSAPEVVGCITQKEKWDDFRQELERLEEYRLPFVICEFPLSHIETYPHNCGLPLHVQKRIKMRPQFLLMRLEEIWVKYKTRWIFAGTPGLARDVASGLFKRVVENVR